MSSDVRRYYTNDDLSVPDFYSSVKRSPRFVLDEKPFSW